MRGIKYLFVAVLFSLAFLATGERFVYHLAHFEETFWGITFEYGLYGDENSNTLVKDEIAQALEKNDFDVFRVITRYESDYREVKTVYGTQDALDDLRRRGICPQTYNSMFIGEIEIIFKDFSEIENIYESDMFYVVGTLEQAAAFKNISAEDISKSYEVKDVKSLSGSEDGVYATLALVWGIVFLLAVLLTLYEVIISKKEIMVKLTLGESPFRAFAANAAADAAAYSLAFFGLAFLLEHSSHVQYKFGYVCLMFALMLVLNTIVNLLITRVTLKRDFSNSMRGGGALSAAYTLKTVSVIMTCVILSANCVIIAEALDYFKQEKFFESLSDYSYYKINHTAQSLHRLNLAHDIDDELWYEFDSLFGSNSVSLVDLSDSFDHNAVLVNENAVDFMLPYISDDLAAKLNASTEDKLYVYFPPNCSSRTIAQTLSMSSAIFLHTEQESEDTHMIYDEYEGRSEMLGINSNNHLYRSTFLRDPIVILDNTRRLEGDRFLNPLYVSTEILYSIPQAKLDSFVSDNNMENEVVRVTNARDQYYFNRDGIERNLKLMCAISVFIAVLEALTIVFTIRLEYTVNGVEMAIKKTLGYGVLERAGRIVLMPFIIIPVCTAGAAVFVRVFSYGNYLYVIACGAAILIAETVFVISQCKRLDRIKTAQILKGAKI